MVAWLEDRGDVDACPARTDRHPVAHRLGERHHIGAHAGMLEPEPAPGASEAGLDLVDHHQRPGLVAEFADALQVLGRRGMDAALTQDRFDQDGGDAAVDRLAHGVEVAPRNVTEPVGHRREGLVLGGLTSGCERRQRATVEATERADDGVPSATAVLARELDGALVRLGAGVREEDLAPVPRGLEQELVDLHRRLGRDRVGEEVRHVQQPFELVADRLGDDRIRMSERHDGDPGEEVEVALAVGIPEFRATTAFEHDRRGPEHRHERTIRHRRVVEGV